MESSKTSFQLRCKVCHVMSEVHTDNVGDYNSVVVDNFVCNKCYFRVKRLRIVLKCSKCGTEFQTRVLASNIDKYKNWKCPACIPQRGPGSVLPPQHKGECTKCGFGKGVCYFPGKTCKLCDDFYKFGNGDLYSLGKDCTILSVDKIETSRSDIHCFSYTLLYKSTYLISKNNVVIIKQRIGSRKNFRTNVILYKHDNEKNKFVPFFNQTFLKGNDWIVPVKEEILKTGILK